MINLEKIKEYTGADDAFIATLFRKFLGHLDEDLHVLKTEADTKNWNHVRQKTHAMLSSARIFHLDEIIELSMQIEAKVDQNDLADLSEMTLHLIDSYKQLQIEVEAWLSTKYYDA